jgi:hypothetical protein
VGPSGLRIGIAFAVFQLYVAPSTICRARWCAAFHVGFLLLMTFGLIGNFTAKAISAARSAG